MRAPDPGHPVLVGLAYFFCWVAMTWPRVLSFSSHFWMDQGDGLGMIWNIWHASTHPGELWHTNLVLWPDGTSPLLHSYHPLTSWLVAWWPFSLVAKLNLAILLCFVGSGLSMYWLCLRLTGSRWGSFVAGFAFTFTGFHWAHAEGHLNLISMQFLPVFALAWLHLLDQSNWRRSIFAATSLLAVLLSDHYFAVYCVFFAVITLACRRQNPLRLWRFLAVAALTSGALAAVMAWIHVEHGYLGRHFPSVSPLDPLALVVPGAHWRFASLSEPLWRLFPANIHENSVHLGIGLWAAILLRRRRSLWWVVLAVFAVLAMGERARILGYEYPLPLPYSVLARAFPPLAWGGVPVRMSVMVALSASVLGAYAFRDLGRRGIPLVLLLALELWPRPIPEQRPAIPEWVHRLADHGGTGALLDPITGHYRAMYYQTEHGRPVFHAIAARFPSAMENRELELLVSYRAADFAGLRALGFGYVRLKKDAPHLELVSLDGEDRLYYLGEPSPGPYPPPRIPSPR